MKEVLTIVKIGGNIIDDLADLQHFLERFARLDGPKILVHGGGKLASKLAQDLQLPVKMVEGRRITDLDTLNVITMVYAGKINKQIVASLQSQQCNALGFTGADGNTVISRKRPIRNIDYGFVGDVIKVNIEILLSLMDSKIVPVFCAITHDNQGQLLNTNADTMAAEMAKAFAQVFSVHLYYCFEKPGVLRNLEDENSIIKNIDNSSYRELLEQNIIADGMLPKLKNCFDAVNNHVTKVGLGRPEMIFSQNSPYTTITK